MFFSLSTFLPLFFGHKGMPARYFCFPALVLGHKRYTCKVSLASNSAYGYILSNPHVFV
jgi:hypothetical protein